MTITLALIIITCLVSIAGFTRPAVVSDLIFHPYSVSERRQYYRFITHGFVHADPPHLIFNMVALYSFGEAIEHIFSLECVFGNMGKLLYLLLYFTALIMASLPDYVRHRHNPGYQSLGASGAVSAVIFSFIVFSPQTPIGIIFLPAIPGYIFGVLYLGISVYLDRRGGGRINHSAHFWGAAYGIVFTLVFCQLLAGFNVYDNFLLQLHSHTDDTPIPCDFEQ